MAEEKDATGGLPDWMPVWVKQHAGKVMLALIVAVVGGSRMLSHRTEHSANKEQSTPPVVLSPKSLLDRTDDLARREKRLQENQDFLNQRMKAMNQPLPAESSQPQGTRQISPVEQMREQLAAERLRQEYASMWASPISATREGSRPETGDKPADPAKQENASSDQAPAMTMNVQRETDPNQAQFPYDRSAGPYHYIQRGEIFDAVLLTALDGEQGGVVIAQLQEPVYVKNTQTVLLPKGTDMIGTARTVTMTGQHLLAVSFDRINQPDGYAISMDSAPGLSQSGFTGLTGKVDSHWLSALGTGLANGAISAVSELPLLGSNGGYLIYDPSIAIRNNIAPSSKPPTITIPPGTRIHIPLVQDLKGVPEWANHRMIPGAL